MPNPTIKNVAVVGTGIIGRSWIYVFSRVGCQTKVYDKDRSQLEKNITWFHETLRQDVLDGFSTPQEAEDIRSRVSGHTDLKGALSEAMYIQESVPERLEIKKAIFAEMDRLAHSSAIIASSSSGLDINEIAAGLPGMHRCILAHPYNPPYVIPAVEILPTRKASAEQTARAVDFLKSIGQVPVQMNFYAKGFLGNRIQYAIVREAIHLAESGIADVQAIDDVMCHGLGLRYALLGNFGVNNTNADGGIREYYNRFKDAYREGIGDLNCAVPSFSPDMIDRVAKGTEAMVGKASVKELCRWRDRLIRKICALKEKDPHP
jgi:L-gulonate 3-dehydrogenase